MSLPTTLRTRGRAREHARALALLIAVVAATACAGEAPARSGDRNAPSSDSASTSRSGEAGAPAARPDEPDSAAGAWTVETVEVARPDVGQVTLAALRAARHDGWDRLVFELAAEDSLPGYRVSLEEEPPAHCGSGAPMSGAAARWLTVRLIPARAHDEQGGSTLEGRITPALAVVGKGEMICDFEAHVEWAAPVPDDAAVRVLELRGPARLVVDVRSAQ